PLEGGVAGVDAPFVLNIPLTLGGASELVLRHDRVDGEHGAVFQTFQLESNSRGRRPQRPPPAPEVEDAHVVSHRLRGIVHPHVAYASARQASPWKTSTSPRSAARGRSQPHAPKAHVFSPVRITPVRRARTESAARPE